LRRAKLKWAALTTGGFGGFDAWLADASAGTLKIDTPLVKTEIAVADIGRDDLVFANRRHQAPAARVSPARR
jgi:hypothetical protein